MDNDEFDRDNTCGKTTDAFRPCIISVVFWIIIINRRCGTGIILGIYICSILDQNSHGFRSVIFASNMKRCPAIDGVTVVGPLGRG